MSDAISPEDVVYHLPLTAAELKITHAALRSYLLDFGHEEHDVHALVRRVLAKFPDERTLRPIDVSRGL
jgi:hypothetical protein